MIHALQRDPQLWQWKDRRVIFSFSMKSISLLLLSDVGVSWSELKAIWPCTRLQSWFCSPYREHPGQRRWKPFSRRSLRTSHKSYKQGRKSSSLVNWIPIRVERRLLFLTLFAHLTRITGNITTNPSWNFATQEVFLWNIQAQIDQVIGCFSWVSAT